MKINKLKKDKNNFYKIFIDEKEYLLHEDILIENELLIRKDINKDELDKYLEKNDLYIALDLANKYLKKKMRSEYEIREYLNKSIENQEIIDQVIDILKNRKHIDEDLYSESYISDKINFSNWGPERIRKELRNLKIKDEIIEKHLNNYTKDLEIKRVEDLVNKRLKLNKKSLLNFKSTTYKYLLNLGYSSFSINKVLNNIAFDDSNLLEKEKAKLRDKYKRKYEGRELEYKIKEGLYRKGFRI